MVLLTTAAFEHPIGARTNIRRVLYRVLGRKDGSFEIREIIELSLRLHSAASTNKVPRADCSSRLPRKIRVYVNYPDRQHLTNTLVCEPTSLRERETDKESG